MLVRADRAFPPGTPVALALEAAGALLEFAQGEVVWQHRDGGIGLRFTRLSPRALALVEHLVARGGTAYLAPPVAASPPRRGRSWRSPALGACALLATVALLVGWRLSARHPSDVAAPATVIAAPALTRPAAPAVVPAAASVEVTPRESEIAIPTGAVRSIRITLTNQEVSVEPALRRNAVIKRIFNLARPPRLVIDVAGREPLYSWQLEGNAVVKSVRVGARDHGTRVVVDLPDPLDELRKGYTLIAARTR